MTRKYKLSEFPDPVEFLHIRCGDDILRRLDEAGVPGDKIRWADMLCEGPLHAHQDESQRQKERAAYVAERYFMPVTETYREIRGADWRVSQCVRYDEAVLWFEADLFDQAILVYLLQRLAPLAAESRISLICIGSFPGIERFVGLGQLTPSELASLLPTRRPVSRRQFALARQTWAAFNQAHPRDLVKISRIHSRALPFLGPALQRYLAEYPSTTNGLSCTAQYALEAIAGGATTPMAAFPVVQQREARPFMGDWMFYAVLRDLASGDHPALAGAHKNLHRLPNEELRACPVWLTALGRKLLAGSADWCALSGLSRWMGGVLLQGPEPRWRWDPGRARLVEQRGRARQRRRSPRR